METFIPFRYGFDTWEYNAQENKDFKCCKNGYYVRNEVWVSSEVWSKHKITRAN